MISSYILVLVVFAQVNSCFSLFSPLFQVCGRDCLSITHQLLITYPSVN